jgi:hypothetical protein
MSDYAQITTFVTKDALITGNPSKAVKGSELDAEFAAISTAVLSKFDSADLSDQTTAEAGTNNTALMTPLRVAQLVAAITSTVAKYKTAAETVSNSAALQDDDDLVNFSVAAAGAYKVHGILIVSIKAASDFKCALTFGSAPTSLNVQFVGALTTDSTSVRGYQTSSGTAVAFTTAADQTLVVLVDGMFVANAATTVKLQWAQNTAVAENTVMNIASFLELTKVA